MTSSIPSWRTIPCLTCTPHGRGGLVLRDDLVEDGAMVTAQADLFWSCDADGCGAGTESGRIPCVACDGEGYREMPSGAERRDYRVARALCSAIRREVEGFATPTESIDAWYASCDRHLAEAYRDAMRRRALPDCETCEGYGSTACDACGGAGGDYVACDACDEPIDSDSYREVCYSGDGFIVCESCAWVPCPDCGGSERAELAPLTRLGREMHPVGASCSCCGAAPHGPDAYAHGRSLRGPLAWGWYCYRAQISDTDGVYYSYLCGNEHGTDGCLADVLEQQVDIPADTREGLDSLRADSGDDDDGLQNNAQDLLGFKGT